MPGLEDEDIPVSTESEDKALSWLPAWFTEEGELA